LKAYSRQGKRARKLGVVIEFRIRTSYVGGVPITLEQIVEETQHWPRAKVNELVGRLSEGLSAPDPAVEDESKHETNRRLAEIENGTAEITEGEDVSARIRKITGGIPSWADGSTTKSDG